MFVRLLLISFLIFAHHTRPSLATGEDVYLLEFKDGLKNTSALDSTWRNVTHPCRDKWKGVICDEDDKQHVSRLLLVNLGLYGDSKDIDIDALAMLPTLRTISLEKNSFSGPLPEFNRLTTLRSLYIQTNQFSGEIPKDFFKNMKSLRRIELNENNFSGPIPDSLGKLRNLQFLKLYCNRFSGPIPIIAQESLKEIDLSYNELQGEVPETMMRFGPKPFLGNHALCGPIFSITCPEEIPPPLPENNSSTTKWVILGVVVTFLVMTLLFSKSNKNSSVLAKENPEEVVQLHIPRSNTDQRSCKKRGNYNDPGRQSSMVGSIREKSSGDLVMVNEEKGIFGMHDLMKASAEVIASGGLGLAYKAIMANGVSVIVKRYSDMNKLNMDAFDAEVRRLGRIRHRNILPPLAYHYRNEEKLFVSEFVPKGSLMFLLHGDRGISHAELTWPIRLKLIKGVARGMGYLHTEFANYELPHGNLKSSNILISSNYEPLLTDYMLYSLLSNTHSVQTLFSYKCPEAVLYQQLSPKSDVYCLGIVVLEIMTGKYPSQYLNNQTGGTDLVQWVMKGISADIIAELIDPGIVNDPDSLDQMEKMLKIAVNLIAKDHDKRVEMREAIRSIEEVEV